ncbi:MAG: hypothetical protein M3R25_00335 [Bacteroidota bacterium]|nr:hypothetical protein [Bacteroidota bacterium]
MKSFISHISLVLFFLIGLISVASAQSGDQAISFKVYGVCEDCKNRIELAAMDAKGVKKAEWDKQSNVLALAGSSKMTKENVAAAVAKAGYKSDVMEADPKGYAKLPTCCQYVSDTDKH